MRRHKQQGYIYLNSLGGFWARQPSGSFTVDAADFDGSNDYMNRGALTGQAATKTGIFSAWFRLDSGAVGGDLFNAADLGAGWEILRVRVASTFGQININGNNVAAGDGFQISATMTVSTQTWYHVLASWDTLNNLTHLYVNDVNEKDSGATVNQNIDFGLVDSWTVGAYEQDVSFGGGGFVDACIAEVYCAPGQFLDFSTESNRRKFISATGKPVDLGTTGSTPTGSTPLVYLHLGDGESVSNFATNRAGTGNFTISGGGLATCASSPSD
jgi:hypothetical protein